MSNQYGTIQAGGCALGIADRNLSEKRTEIMTEARERVENSPQAARVFDIAIQCGVDIREQAGPKPRATVWAAFRKGLEEGESPNAKDRLRVIKALLGCSRRNSAGAARAIENGGGLCRDSVEATRVVLREKGIESFSQLLAYFKETKTSEEIAVDAMVKAAIDFGETPEAYLLTLVAKAVAKAEKAKAAGVKANEAKAAKAAKAKAGREKINAKAALKRAAGKAKKAAAEEARLAKLAA
jgi:histone H1/5